MGPGAGRRGWLAGAGRAGHGRSDWLGSDGTSARSPRSVAWVVGDVGSHDSGWGCRHGTAGVCRLVGNLNEPDLRVFDATVQITKVLFLPT
jgi:hypothetical protein